MIPHFIYSFVGLQYTNNNPYEYRNGSNSNILFRLEVFYLSRYYNETYCYVLKEHKSHSDVIGIIIREEGSPQWSYITYKSDTKKMFISKVANVL